MRRKLKDCLLQVKLTEPYPSRLLNSESLQQVYEKIIKDLKDIRAVDN